MKKTKAFIIGFFIILTFLFLPQTVAAADAKVKMELPVLITSCGQSPGPMKLKVFMKRLKLGHTYNLQASAQDLQNKKSGSPYKTLIIVTGASLKGMGAAGVSVEDELARTNKLIAEARKLGIKIIGAHLEGMARRAKGSAAGDNSDELSIDAVCPKADALLVRKDGNEDGRFTAISTDKNIPLMLFEKNMELGNVLKQIFNSN